MGDHFCGTRIDRSPLHLPEPRPGQVEHLSARGFSSDSLETAEVVGVLDILQNLAAAERSPGTGVPLLLARQEVTQRLLLAMLDVHSTLAAIDCAGERGAHLRGQLLRIDGRRSRNLGLAGLVIGGATAAITGGLSLASLAAAGDVAGIIGGSLGSAVGGAQLYEAASGPLRTSANLLDEIRRQPAQSSLFPPTVWRYLTRRDAPDQPSIAEEVVAEWRSAGLLGEEDEGEMVFAAEARFTVDDLDRRDAMFDLLEARISLMSRELRLLLEEVVARPTPALAGSRPRRR